MKRILLLALSALTVAANAQFGIIPNARFDTINCDTDDSLRNLLALDGQVVNLMWIGLPENPPEAFGLQSRVGVPFNTEALEIRVASTSMHGDVIDQTIQVFDFVTDDWVTVSTSKIGGPSGTSAKFLTVIVTSPLALFPPPFIEPGTGAVLTRVLWDWRQTPGAIVDLFDVRAFNGN